MEALLKLEKVQRVLSLMGSRGLSGSGSDSGASDGGGGDRFLAHFLLFLILHKNDYDILHYSKEACLNQYFNWDPGKGSGQFESSTLSSPHAQRLQRKENQKSGGLLVRCSGGLLVQPFDSLSMEKKALLVSDLLRKLDDLNEYNLQMVPGNDASLTVLERENRTSNEASLTGMLNVLDDLLQRQGLMTDQLERKLCQALSRNDKISIEDVMEAIHLKSFDYRVLNLLMYRLTGQQVNEVHMEFLSISEFLVEISDDLYDYEDDVMNNTFNILRMFAAIYGPSEAPKMLAKCIGEAEEKYERFSKKLDPTLSGSYWRRCEEATKEGGKMSGHAYGTWNIPPLIRDEEFFRLERSNKHDASAITIT
uniref:Glycosyltransferase n=1 Tax=Oryza nivara TaxID=4536 RepID=A0A0E0H1J7_ORYNI